VVGIITSKQQKFSQSDQVLIRQFSKKLQSDAVVNRAHLCWLGSKSAEVCRANLLSVRLSPFVLVVVASSQQFFFFFKPFQTLDLGVSVSI